VLSSKDDGEKSSCLDESSKMYVTLLFLIFLKKCYIIIYICPICSIPPSLVCFKSHSSNLLLIIYLTCLDVILVSLFLYVHNIGPQFLDLNI